MKNIVIEYEEDGVGGRACKTYTGMTGFIQSQIDLLTAFKNDGRIPSQELIDDIAGYEWMKEDESRIHDYINYKDHTYIRPGAFWKLRTKESRRERDDTNED